MNSKDVKRIEEISVLRSRQFAEDNGPMSHPIRPDSYVAIDNFYTTTIYNKGAEVIRMYQTILSDDGFKKGFSNYIAKHDGKLILLNL